MRRSTAWPSGGPVFIATSSILLLAAMLGLVTWWRARRRACRTWPFGEVLKGRAAGDRSRWLPHRAPRAAGLGGIALGLAVSAALEWWARRHAEELGLLLDVASFHFPAWLIGGAVGIALAVRRQRLAPRDPRGPAGSGASPARGVHAPGPRRRPAAPRSG